MTSRDERLRELFRENTMLRDHLKAVIEASTYSEHHSTRDKCSGCAEFLPKHIRDCPVKAAQDFLKCTE